jgi:hypothetical protein
MDGNKKIEREIAQAQQFAVAQYCAFKLLFASVNFCHRMKRRSPSLAPRKQRHD